MRVRPVPVFMAVTVAFAITAPEESVTDPLSAPVEAVCALSLGANITRTAAITSQACLMHLGRSIAHTPIFLKWTLMGGTLPAVKLYFLQNPYLFVQILDLKVKSIEA